jgi:hypothetical protein
MMKGVALVAIVVAIAFTYWRPLRSVRTALGVDHLVSTGHAFLVLGYLLGLVSGDRTAPVVDDIGPIVAFVAGWVGFATGMRFDFRVLRGLPVRAFVVAVLPGLAAASVLGGVAGAALVVTGLSTAKSLSVALTLGAAAASSGPTLVGVLRARRAGRSSAARPVLRMIEFSAGVDDVVVIVLAMLAFAVHRPESSPLHSVLLIVIAGGGGALLGVVTWLFLGGRASEDERLLLGLAMLAFIAGFSGWLYLSPAGVAAIAAIVLVNLPGARMDQLLVAVRRVERSAVVILMAVTGFHLTGHMTWMLLPLVFMMTVVRLVTKLVAGDLGAERSSSAPGLDTARGWGLGLAPQGTFGLVVTLSFFHVWHDDISRTVLGAVAAASLINEMIAPWLLLRLVRSVAVPAPASTARKTA